MAMELDDETKKVRDCYKFGRTLRDAKGQGEPGDPVNPSPTYDPTVSPSNLT